MRIRGYYWSFLLLPVLCFGQERAEFTRGQEFYLQGNASIIGNSILGKSASKSFNKSKKSNDEFKMRYIDIDNDPETWSSSSAYFSIPEDAQLVYAGLYWSATYNGESGGLRLRNHRPVYKKLENRKHDARIVKIKPPNGSYIEVTGSLIYDGKDAKNSTVKSRAPYAYSADVTEVLKEYHKGDITVANVAATQGKINGGSSAGWLLYLVYEDASEPFRYITTYYGLESIKNEVVEIDFGNFKSSENEEGATYITVAALEGDSNLGKDQIEIYNPESDLFLPFGNAVRPVNNFFNSSITLEDEMILSRNPKSTNTLGFDIAQVKMPDELNTIIANSSQGVRMKFNTKGDHYFLFFTAFQTTISESWFQEKTSLLAEESETETETEVAIDAPTETLEVTKVIEEAPIPDNHSNTFITPSTAGATPTVQNIRSNSIPMAHMRRGFYIITNVFAKEENARKWEQKLRSKGYASDTFFRPEDNYHYVSIGNNVDLEIVRELLQRVRTDRDLKKSWVLKVNM